MDLDQLWRVAELSRGRKRLSPEDAVLVREVFPEELAGFPKLELPRRVRHPTGFSISGTPVRTFTSCALLLSGKRVLGRRYDNVEFYERVEKDLAFHIMRAHFHHGYPKGAYCCVQCTLAVLPVLDAQAIRWFDCRELHESVRGIVERGEWRFSKPAKPKMVNWALGKPAS
jgi:hypothetical protein